MTSLERYFEMQDKIIAKDKENTLIVLGIIEKEYAPDGKSSYLYSKYEYINGEKRYYREIPAQISDEEYAEVLKKKELVEAIHAKEQQERDRKYTIQKLELDKTWVPIFSKPKSQWSIPNETDATPTGKSKTATILRCITWASIVICVMIGIIMIFENPIISGAILGGVVVESLMFFALSEILDNMAEQTAILRGGLIYKEKTNK